MTGWSPALSSSKLSPVLTRESLTQCQLVLKCSGNGIKFNFMTKRDSAIDCNSSECSSKWILKPILYQISCTNQSETNAHGVTSLLINNKQSILAYILFITGGSGLDMGVYLQMKVTCAYLGPGGCLQLASMCPAYQWRLLKMPLVSGKFILVKLLTRGACMRVSAVYI